LGNFGAYQLILGDENNSPVMLLKKPFTCNPYTVENQFFNITSNNVFIGKITVPYQMCCAMGCDVLDEKKDKIYEIRATCM